jgi:hypothetical protein
MHFYHPGLNGIDIYLIKKIAYMKKHTFGRDVESGFCQEHFELALVVQLLVV